jgi:Flavin containing amine oxidoreductase
VSYEKWLVMQGVAQSQHPKKPSADPRLYTNTRLYFAGEATHKLDFGTVHGAYDSGESTLLPVIMHAQHRCDTEPTSAWRASNASLAYQTIVPCQMHNPLCPDYTQVSARRTASRSGGASFTVKWAQTPSRAEHHRALVATYLASRAAACLEHMHSRRGCHDVSAGIACVGLCLATMHSEAHEL